MSKNKETWAEKAVIWGGGLVLAGWAMNAGRKGLRFVLGQVKTLLAD